MATVIQVKRGTASSWTSANTVLAAGEIGFESDTKKMKVGDGSTAWTSLLYTSTDGDITAVVAGTGLSGGSTSGSATLSIDTATTVDKTTAQTLTNKDLTSGTNTFPTSLATLTGSQTLTNKTLTNPLINLTITTNSGAYTLQASDSGKLVEMSSATAVALTVPPSVFAAGEQVNVIATGAASAVITFTAGSGVTILSVGATAAAPKLRAQYSSATLICKTGGATPTFYVVGDIS